MPTLDAPVTTVKAKRLQLVCNDREEVVSECGFSNWQIMANKLAWSAVSGSSSFTVWVGYEDESDWTLADVRVGKGDHYAIFRFDGKPESGRIITDADILPVVRLFTSCMVIQKRLMVTYKSFEQLGMLRQEAPPVLVIRPMPEQEGHYGHAG